MNNDLNYQVIELNINDCPVLQTIGLSKVIGVELCIHLVISKPLARGLISQIAQYYRILVDQPSLFNDPWIQYVLKENNILYLIPFVLLKDEGICYIIVPDLEGLYPWQLGCKLPFNKQVDEKLMLTNFLIAIKAAYLSYLIKNVATKVYEQIGLFIDLKKDILLEEIPDYLAENNLDMYIVLTLCFNETMPQINQAILSSCQSITLNLMNLPNPVEKASEIALQLYDPIVTKKYISMIMRTFHKLTE